MPLSRALESSPHRNTPWAACTALGPSRQKDRSAPQHLSVPSPFPCTLCITVGLQGHYKPLFWGDHLCLTGSHSVPRGSCQGRAVSYQGTCEQILGRREALALFSHRLPHPWASLCTCHSYHAFKWFFSSYIKGKMSALGFGVCTHIGELCCLLSQVSWKTLRCSLSDVVARRKEE